MKFNLVQRDDYANLTVVIDGEPYNVDNTHPNYDDILDAVLNDQEDDVIRLIDPSNAVAEFFESLTDIVSVANGRVYVDGDEVTGPYCELIVQFLREGKDDWKPLAKFLEKVYTNNNEHTRDNLARWINATKGFTINTDGNIVGYKGLTQQGGSVHKGPAVVNGTAVNGSVPNPPGAVITMARSKVTHDPSVACAAGLHVGTWEYASSFGHGVTAEVEVNPRDVVSVPTDCNGQKMRVSRYRVVRYLDAAYNDTVVESGFEPAEDYDDDSWGDDAY